jgi:uncharacterized membrane protein (DUF485 family)
MKDLLGRYFKFVFEDVMQMLDPDNEYFLPIKIMKTVFFVLYVPMVCGIHLFVFMGLLIIGWQVISLGMQVGVVGLFLLFALGPIWIVVTKMFDNDS